MFPEYFSSLVQYSDILPVFVLPGSLFCFLFCIIVSNVGKNWIFWSIQSVMGFGICGHRFRRSPFTNKIFYIYKCHPSFCSTPPCSALPPETMTAWNAPVVSLVHPSELLARRWNQFGSPQKVQTQVCYSLRIETLSSLKLMVSFSFTKAWLKNIRGALFPLVWFSLLNRSPRFILSGRDFPSTLLNVFTYLRKLVRFKSAQNPPQDLLFT